MSLVNPIWLWGIAALAIPLAIHLLSRKEGKVIRIGSIRHLTESTTQQFKSIRLNEILLLALRCLTILLLVLLLADLLIPRSATDRWILAEPGLETNDQARPLIDSLTKHGYESHVFSQGFPTSTENAKDAPCTYGLLLDELRQANLQDAIVLASSRVTELGSEPVQLPPAVKWMTIEPRENSFLLAAKRTDPSHVLVRSGTSNADRTSFSATHVESPFPVYKSAMGDSIPVTPTDTLRYALEVASAYDHLRPIIESSLRVMAASTGLILFPTQEQPDWTFWLSDKESPTSERNVIRVATSNTNEVMWQDGATSWFLHANLTDEMALREHLPVKLASAVLDATAARTNADNHDLRTMPEEMMWTRSDSSSESEQKASSVSQLLIALLLFAWLAERILSFRKKL